MAPAVMVTATMISIMCERGSLRVSRARCWAVESRVMNEASVEEEPGESSGEYAMGKVVSSWFRGSSGHPSHAQTRSRRPLLTFP